MQAPLSQIQPAKAAKYLVCVDGREECRAALRLAAMKAAGRGHQIVLLHVIAPVDFQTLGGIADRMREERKHEAEQLLSALIEEIRAAYGIVPTAILREGAPGDEILAVALDDSEIALLAIGIAQPTAGRGKLALWLTGQLGNKLQVPLLMVPGSLTDQQMESLV